MRNLLKIICAVSVVIFVSDIASAESEVKVALVDIQKALSGSVPGKSAQKQYEKEVKEAQGELDVKKKEYESLQATLKKQKESLSKQALSDKQEKLISLEKEIKRSYGDLQEELRRKNMQLVGDLIKKLREVVAEVGKEEGYSVVLEKGGQSVLYADNSLDITEKVIEKFNSSK